MNTDDYIKCYTEYLEKQEKKENRNVQTYPVRAKQEGDTCEFKTKQNNVHKKSGKNPQNRIAAFITAIGVATGAFILSDKSDKKPTNTEDTPETYTISVEFDEPEALIDIPYANSSNFEKEKNNVETPSETAIRIINNNDDVKEQYDRLNDALNRLSDDLGEDALPLIKKRVKEIGDENIKPIDVIKILWIESKGRIYDAENPNQIIKSDAGAIGPFQLTPETVDTLNNRFDLKGTGKELNVKNPYDNLDACIYNLRYIYQRRESQLEKGVEFPDGIGIKEAVVWGYHDGPNSSYISSAGKDYIESFNELSVVDKYPEVVDYLLNNNR